ncbi:MAG: class I SAM-dependent methyltransferase [Candidatus Woesearchaeota archaeon]|nr:class I SAM-dependent methyltransferase [Candidatus Woesearchaeota archaeon]
MFRTQCVICASEELTEILDFGMHPFADTFLREEDLAEGEKVYPLICMLCSGCGHVQLKCSTDPMDRYVDHDYSYTSSNSAYARNHWDAYCEEVAKHVHLKDGLVIEVGSNDGYLTELFQKRGNPSYGIDPSPYMANLAKERGVETVVGLFGTELVPQLLPKGKAELIIANNVFNHADTPVDFVKAAAQLLAPNGTFVFELPYWLLTVDSGKFDQIYHEHVNYFTATASEEVIKRAGLAISHIELADYHGGCLRVFAKHPDQVTEPSASAETFKQDEQAKNIFDPATYEQFMATILKNRVTFLEKVYDIKKQGGTIIAVGAAAKGNTLLNFYNLTSATLTNVTDVSEHKKGKYTPYTRIPIAGDDVFAQYENVYALTLAWNLSDTLKKVLRSINPNVKFISPWDV